MYQPVEYITWEDGRPLSLPSMTAAIRYAQIHGLHQLRGWRVDSQTQECHLCPLIREGNIWKWLDLGQGRELTQRADPSDDPMVLSIVDNLEINRGHGDHQLLVRCDQDHWPPDASQEIDPLGRWTRVGFLPPSFLGDVDDANFCLFYQPETMAKVMTSISSDLEEVEAMTNTLVWRHMLSVEHRDLPFDERERLVDDVVLDSGGPAREYLIKMLVAT